MRVKHPVIGISELDLQGLLRLWIDGIFHGIHPWNIPIAVGGRHTPNSHGSPKGL